MDNSDKMAPIFISSGDRKIVVFGGGKVALRKCRHFDGFRIKVVAEDVLPEFKEIAEEVLISKIDEDSISQNISDAFMVVAATSDKRLNGKIRDTAIACGVLVNSAHGGGDVLIPSVLEKRNYTVTVSTGGKVPAFPPYVVEKLDPFLDESYDLMMDLMMDLRPMVMDGIASQQARAEYLARVLRDENVWNCLRGRDLKGAMETAKRIGDLR
jgi:precorrin-2 dehydrogenase / sirohydrochlorin ferrochelatase